MKIRRIAPALLAIAISGYGLYNVAGEDVKAIFNDYKEKFSMESDIDTFVTEDKPEIIDTIDIPEVITEKEPEIVNVYDEEKSTYLINQGYEFKSLDFVKYNEENPEVVGYISFPGTAIDYKVYQSAPGTEPAEDYYLHNDSEGHQSVMGSNGKWKSLYSEIYINSNVDLSLGDNTDSVQTSTIDMFGHNQHNGKMFTDLMKYKDQTFLNSHPYGVYYTEDGSVYALEVVGGYLTSGETLEHIHVDNINEQYKLDEFMNYLNENAKVRSNVEVELGDKIVCLSTCSYEHDNYRYVLVCKAVKQFRSEEEYYEYIQQPEAPIYTYTR